VIKSFKLAGRTFTVETVDALHSDALGRAISDLNKILIYTKWQSGDPVPESTQEQTLLHEVLHCIFEVLGRDDLSQDETLVQSVSLLLHQYRETAK